MRAATEAAVIAEAVAAAKAEAKAAMNTAAASNKQLEEKGIMQKYMEEANKKAVEELQKQLEEKGIIQKHMEEANKKAVEELQKLSELQGKLINEDLLKFIKKEVNNRNIPRGSDDINKTITGKEEQIIRDTKGAIQNYINSVSHNSNAEPYRILTVNLDLFSLNMLVSLLSKGYDTISIEQIKRKKKIYLYILMLITKYIVTKALSQVVDSIVDSIESIGLFIKEHVNTIETKLETSTDKDKELKYLLPQILHPIRPLFTHLITLDFKNNENIEKIEKILTDKINLIIPDEESFTPATGAAKTSNKPARKGGTNLKKNTKKKIRRSED